MRTLSAPSLKDLIAQMGQQVQRVQNVAPSSEELVDQLEMLIERVINGDQRAVQAYVDKLRLQYPGISNAELARKIVHRKSLKCGLIGAVTSSGGLITLPFAIPVDIAGTWRFQINMVVCIAYIFGHTTQTTDLKTDMFLIMAGDSAKEALKQFGVAVSKDVTRRLVDKYVTREVMVQINKVVGRKIITKAGEKSLTSFTKMVPLVGMPVGFAFDWSATKAVGHTAIRCYSGG